MFTIKKAVELTGIAAATLRAWEQRYGVGTPRRTEGGYRVYDQSSIDEIIQMQKLLDKGWRHQAAAAEILLHRTTGQLPNRPIAADSYLELSTAFLAAARSLDDEMLGAVLDIAFSRGSFESVVDTWLFPTLRLLGQEWIAGNLDIASEHFASNAIMRRLGAAFEGTAAGSVHEKVVVGTPTGSFHEIGTLALAVAMRRQGIGVVYLGVNVPAEVWVDAVNRNRAIGAAISVVMEQDVTIAQGIVDELNRSSTGVMIAVGGAFASSIHHATLVLQGGISESAKLIAQSLRAAK
jgi:methanogenic corrinoid protein MtbC1